MMVRQVLPRVGDGALHRPELERLLDTWSPLTIVRAPLGYGKTAVLAEWLERQPAAQVRRVWITLDAELGEPRALERRLLEELADAEPESDAHPAVRGRMHRVHRRLRALGGQSRRVAIVLDRAAYLVEPRLLVDVVELVRRHRHVHLIISSRGPHPIEAVAAGSTDYLVVGPEHFGLSAHDIVRLSAQLGARVCLERARDLESAVGGWPALVRLILQERGTTEARAVARRYLGAVVLPQLPADQARSLLQLSVAGDLTIDQFLDAMQHPEPAEFAAQIEGPGLLRVADDGLPQPRWVLPPLIRDALREHYRMQCPAGVASVHLRLAKWHARQADPAHQLRAVEHAAGGEHLDLLYELWAEQGMRLSYDHPKQLLRALTRLPSEALARYPGIRVSIATLSSRLQDSDADGRAATLRSYYEASLQAEAQDRIVRSISDVLYAGTGHLIGLRLGGAFDQARALGREIADTVARERGPRPVPVDRLAWLHLQRALTETLAGDDDQAIALYNLTWGYRLGTGVTYIPANVAANLAMTAAMRGDAVGTASWLQHYRGFDTKGSWAHRLASIGRHVAEALQGIDRLDPDAAVLALHELGDGGSTIELWPFVAYAHAQQALHFGDPATGLDALQDAMNAHEPVLSGQGAAQILILRAKADLLIADGRAQQARTLLDSPDAPRSALLGVPRARIHLLAGENGDVARITRSLSEQMPTRRSRLELMLLQAVAAARSNDVGTAARMATRALARARAAGDLRALTLIAASDLADLDALAGSALALTAIERTALDGAARPFPRRQSFITLTNREWALVGQLRTETSRQRIAESLYVSLNTIKSQTATLYRKLDVTNRDDALRRLGELGLI